MLNIAGVENIAGKEPVAYPQVNKEWIVERNPQVVVKLGTSKLPLGYEEKDTNRIEKYANKIITRTGWNKIDAVKNKKVYIMSNEIGTSTRSVVGIYYLAKWCYPGKFKDLNPEKVHKELLEKFYNVKYKGIWTYPNN